MPEHILAAVAWPYANSNIHVGNITGSYLPADIFTRYHRLKGNQVIMVSGSDAHGTPVTVRADAEGSTAYEVYQKYHAGFIDLFQKLGISYDLFTSTHTDNHFKVSQAIFLALQENGFLYTQTEKQWYTSAQGRFLPDRYVEGTCYICGYTSARGDQCDQCGNLLDATQLIDPRSKIDNSTPELRETKHFYLDLGKLEPQIVSFLEKRRDYWRPNVIRQSLGQILADHLHGRPITRDLDWGIPVPVEGWEGKCLYVWFEAVIGYLSAAIEWASLQKTPERWYEWWYQSDVRSFYFIGKDNIPFHAVIWPGQLIGSGEQFGKLFDGQKQGDLVLPYDVPANEFMNLEGRKISGSRNWAVWGLDFLSRYDPDPLRYYLTNNMPESKDTDWDWQDFLNRNNNELVATWGNLANRMLSFAFKNWGGCVPVPGELSPADHELLERVEASFTSIGEQFESVHLRAALNEAMALAAEVNKYLDTTAPWFSIKENKEAAATSVYVALRCIDSIKILLAPIVPFSSEKLNLYLGHDRPLFGEQFTETVNDSLGSHTILGYRPDGASGKWEPSRLAGGEKLNSPSPLYRKLDVSIVEEERQRLSADQAV
jgi:methionyl-tRNA synthetase